MINNVSTPQRGLFVVLEGIDGSGTTTQINLVFNELSRRNYSVYCTREPSDGPVGRLIRCVLSGQIEFDRSDATMALLFASDRMDHLNSAIIPALDVGMIALCDRYYFSSMAYQSVDERSEDFVRTVNGRARPPDLTIVLDLELKEAKRRLDSRSNKDYTEVDDIQKRAHTWYRGIKQKFYQDIVIINSNDDPMLVSSKVCEEIERKLSG